MPDPRVPTPENIRDISQATRGFGWIDHRISWFWDNMTQHELLLYFYLVATADRDGCSWHSNRQMTKVLKIGPSSIIKARQMLEERGIISCKKDDLSQRIIFQVLPLPIEKNESVEIPMTKDLSAKKPKKVLEEVPSDEQFVKNMEHLSRIKEILND